ncbi:DUF547 domain-containing protein [Limnobacter litoralis]|uniref:DUF547 domain-containing protein n=1 Tax=Limnobacter litoralis TaxID=481366 RepID=A0ABQ5YSF9_9BURK|nr:DUF547 domain-containing protein [Limnobacter litoralis]GLR26997.1 DUF547 domain-containing protein [Limnobacter litoralis]
MFNRMRIVLTGLICAGFMQVATLAWATPIDSNFKQWNQLLQKHVQWLPGKTQSRVDYAGFKSDKAQLDSVLKEWSGLTQAEFSKMDVNTQKAFLINAYNGFTIELILSKYPDLKSIKDLGSLFSSPWKKDFFTLLGATHNLDWIENSQLRAKYKDPRIHTAINCASIGCPALLDEAFVPGKLDKQLDEGMQRFLKDHTRNYVKDGELHVSPIFKWFGDDFAKGYQGFNSIQDVFAKYASVLGNSPQDVAAIQSKSMPVQFEDYDWSLNDIKR